jgi:hypothetical protein
MFSIAFGWIAALLFAGAFLSIFMLYLRMRTFSNRIMAVASTEFHAAADSMMETPEDLPESVLDAISRMSVLARSRNVSGHLARMIGNANSETVKDLGPERLEFQRELDSMRPELQDLFHKAVTGWINYVKHQNVVHSLRISFAMLRFKSQGLNSSKAEETAGFNFLSGPDRSIC